MGWLNSLVPQIDRRIEQNWLNGIEDVTGTWTWRKGATSWEDENDLGY